MHSTGLPTVHTLNVFNMQRMLGHIQRRGVWGYGATEKHEGWID